DVWVLPTTTTLASSASPSVLGRPVTFTATVAAVAPGTGTPTGTVTFSDGATALGTVALSGGAAGLSTHDLAAGDHSITAMYGGDATFSGSTATTLNQTIESNRPMPAACGAGLCGAGGSMLAPTMLILVLAKRRRPSPGSFCPHDAYA